MKAVKLAISACGRPECLSVRRRYTYTSEDVSRMIEERRAKGAKGLNVAAERMRLTNLREYEAGRGDADAVARCADCQTGVPAQTLTHSAQVPMRLDPPPALQAGPLNFGSSPSNRRTGDATATDFEPCL